MDLSFQQLLFLIIAAIVLVMRVLRGRVPTESERGAGEEEEETPPPFPSTRRPSPTAPEPRRAPPPRTAPARPVQPRPVQPPPSAARPPSPPPKPVPQIPLPTAPVPAMLATRGPVTAPSPRPRPWPAEVLRQTDGLRRSVVLMTVLGPPRSIEPPP